MSIVKERVVLRKRRREGGRTPHRIKLDAVRESDSLLVEIVIDKKYGPVYRYLFAPGSLSGRQGVVFRENGGRIYWLGGLNPKEMTNDEAEALSTQSTVLKKTERFPDAELTGIRYNVLVFGMHDSLVAVYRTLGDVAAAMNLRAEAIDKLCRTKRHSTETGYSFRYKRKAIDFDVTDFTLTLSRYDELCKRKPVNKN